MASSRGRQVGLRRGEPCLRPLKGERCHFPNQEENHMMFLLSTTGLRYGDNASRPGAQTGRRGGAGPVGGLLGGKDPTGRFSRIL